MHTLRCDVNDRVRGYNSSLLGNCLVVVVVILLVWAQYFYREHRDTTVAVTEEESTAHAKALFDKFDLDGKGITLEELGFIVKRVDQSVTPEQVEVIFSTADTDGGGFISFDEFYEAMKSGSDDNATLDLALVVKQKQAADRQSDALTKVFLIVFLFYPGMTNKIFEGFICRDLGGDPATSVLEVDYSVDCEEDKALRYVRQVFLTLIWPVGLPVVLYVWMHRAKDLILAEDEDTLLRKFDFVLGDYKREYWFWEVVELFRKLILSGVIGLFGRGTIAQSFAAVVISFFFFVLSVHKQPFVSNTMNFIKAVSEFQIFGILLVCTILQTDKNGLPVVGLGTESFYGTVQIVLTVFIFPLVIYIVGGNVRALRGAKNDQEDKDAREQEMSSFENPVTEAAADDIEHTTAKQ